jgi:hypothetical protein
MFVTARALFWFCSRAEPRASFWFCSRAEPRASTRAALSGALLLSASCMAKPAALFDLQLRVESDPGRAVAQASLVRDGEVLTQTDARGQATLHLRGSPGEVVALQVTCPSGYRSPDKAVSVVLRPLLEGRMPQYRASCQPLLRHVVVAVRAQNGPDLPLRYLGKEIARTDRTGAGHALLELAPGETATLTLDTSGPAHARLMPQNPELKLTIQERDELVVFDQSFTLAAEKRKHKRARESLGPTRI